MSKPKVAFYWCASCGGCEEAVVDLADKILDVAAAVEIVLWPVALDFKLKDVEAIPDGGIAATFINGAIRTSEQEEWARLLRAKSQLVFAFGSCAHMGGIPGLANLWDRESILETVYGDGVRPSVDVPRFFEAVHTLDEVIPVDYYVPGCPPTPGVVAATLEFLLRGEVPERGSVLVSDHALCEECPRKDTRPTELTIERFKRPHRIIADEAQCLLAQGLLCLGPATACGCGALCVNGNMPCSGCFGPVDRVRDFGAKALSAVASAAGAKDPAEIVEAFANIPDPAGTFYRYSLPASMLRGRRGAPPAAA